MSHEKKKYVYVYRKVGSYAELLISSCISITLMCNKTNIYMTTYHCLNNRAANVLLLSELSIILI